MKKILVIALIVIGVLLAGCAKKPDATAKAFLKAIENHDFEAAKQYTTKDSQELLTLAKSFMDGMSEEQKEEMKDYTFKIVDTKIEGETAIVTYEEIDSKDPRINTSKEMKLVKEDGNWKVKLDKNSANK
jgi:PBP1b-binding outer membrane lipoprotein LpoB